MFGHGPFASTPFAAILLFNRVVTPPTPPVPAATPATGLISSEGGLGGYLVRPQFGDKSAPGAAYPNDVVLPVYDPNTMRPAPLGPSESVAAEQLVARRRKRNRRRAEAVALALLLLDE